MKTTLLILISYILLTPSHPELWRSITGWVNPEIKSLDDSIIKSNMLEFQVFVPDKYLHKEDNGNEYIKAFLLNKKKRIVKYNCKDATLVGVEIEVLKNGTWQLFQSDRFKIPSGCGNGKWKLEVRKNHFAQIKIEKKFGGNIKRNARIMVLENQVKTYSNTFPIRINPAEDKLIGIPMKNWTTILIEGALDSKR